MKGWNRRKVTLTLLTTAIASTGFLVLDALEKGQGRFVNPIFHIRAQVAKLDGAWREVKTLDLTDTRLAPCEKFAADHEISRHQEDMRRILVGESTSFALTQFGPPTCILANNTYRWLSESGLSVDVVIEEGKVRSAKLKNET